MRPFLIFCSCLALAACTNDMPGKGSAETVTIENERDSSEMKRLFEADQQARSPAEGEQIDWATVNAQDEARRQRVRELLDEGQLQTGADYYHAAFIFQHGGAPEDYLLAHVMATAAMKKGHERADWIAAATLDRYLQSIGRSQIFGTQYIGAGSWSMGDYDEKLLTDEVRAVHSVPPIEEQKEKLESFANGG